MSTKPIVKHKQMKSYLGVQKAFAKYQQSTGDWLRDAGSDFPRSEETVNAIIRRNASCDAANLAYLAYCLNFPPSEIVKILQAYGEELPGKAKEVKLLIRLIQPVELTLNEQTMFLKMRKLSSAKLKVLEDVIDVGLR